MEVGPQAKRLDQRSGRVVDRTGAPVPDALVAIVASSVPMPEIALVSDYAGRFTLRLPPGNFTLRASGPTGTGQADAQGPPAHEEILIVIGS
jgi:hypothetical protein